MTERFKAPEKIQLSEEEIANYGMHSSKHWLLRHSQNWLNLFENQMKK